MTLPSEPTADSAVVDYCGELFTIAPGGRLTIGREADLQIDDNPFLHRRFLVIGCDQGMWFVTNVGAQLSATVSDADGRMEAFLGPGAVLPLVFRRSTVAFTAGPTTYDFTVTVPAAGYQPPAVLGNDAGDTTLGNTRLTPDQRLLVLALAESRLRADGRRAAEIPSSTQAAARLGWTPTKFNRKLDNVCDKLAKLGVRGLRGDSATYASNRRSRLVQYAVATRLVTPDDLRYLDQLVRGTSVDDDGDDE